MKAFRDGQRIVITENGSPLFGWHGTVRRKRMQDDGAWVEMDADLPVGSQSFPDKKDSRYRHILLYPEDCKSELE